MIAVGLLHAAAFALGYFLCKGIGFNEKTARTVSIETGMPLQTLSSTIIQIPSPEDFLCVHMVWGNYIVLNS